MTDQLFIDLAAGGVWVHTEAEEPPGQTEGVQSQRMAWPLAATASEELRWYLEKYHRTPFGVYEDRGPEIAAKLENWGNAVFAAVFRDGPARTCYERVRGRLRQLRIVIRSESAEWMSLPWELMHDPAHALPLAHEVAGLDRSLLTYHPEPPQALPGNRLRVLMVISRPAGNADVEYRMIARPVIERLTAARVAVDLVVLRPPTVDALAAVLTEARSASEPFQVVHFDGHGALVDRRPVQVAGSDPDRALPEGVLIFERSDGSPDAVPASRLAQLIAAAQVPVVILNACYSGAVGGRMEAAAAIQLLGAGASSVVAMAYSVYAVAAAEFMAAFYERLFVGDTISSAVSAGRRRLFQSNLRPSPKGPLPLADWLVPVHYFRREAQFPGLASAGTRSLKWAAQTRRQLDGISAMEAIGALSPAGRFIGRDSFIRDLEVAFRRQQVVIVHGLAGSGKTELAKAFGRWWQETSGVERPEWVFWQSFEPGLATIGLNGVVNDIGLTVFGRDFVGLGENDRIKEVARFLRDRRALLIWDNFDNLHRVPRPSVGPSPDTAELSRLRNFLRGMAGGHSAVLITSRSEEAWLDDDGAFGANATSPATRSLSRLAIGRLLREEAAEYADELLAPHPAATARRAKRAFGDLMEWLAGHPLSMRLVLPHLDRAEPETLLDRLRGLTSLPGPGEEPAVNAGLHYSFSTIEPTERNRLVALCLFQNFVFAELLANFSAAECVPERFRGVTRETWVDILSAAAEAGLLTSLAGVAYLIHPVLPAFLATAWQEDEPATYESSRSFADTALLSAYVAHSNWLRQEVESGNATLAYAFTAGQQRTMCRLLAFALDKGLWNEAAALTPPLIEYWDAHGQQDEAEAWTDQVKHAIGHVHGQVPSATSPAGDLWLAWATSQSRRQLMTGNFEASARSYHEIREIVESESASPTRQTQLAIIYNQIGIATQHLGRLEEAARWLASSLKLNEQLGNQRGTAFNYASLGEVAEAQGQIENAEEFYIRSLRIWETLGDRTSVAIIYNQLGSIARQRGHPVQAGNWHARALRILIESGNQFHIASTYHALGLVSSDTGRQDKAADWFLQALAIYERLDNRSGRASMYHQLGGIALDTGPAQEAEQWYLQELAIIKQLDDPLAISGCYHQLGLAAQAQGRLSAAEDHYLESLAIVTERGHRPGVATAQGQLALLARQQGNLRRGLVRMMQCALLFDDFPSLSEELVADNLAQLIRELGIKAAESAWHEALAQLPLQWKREDGARDLAIFFSSLAMRYFELGHPDDALSAGQESVARLRDLSAGNRKYLEDLAVALEDLSIYLANLNDPQILPAIEETISIRRELAAEHPERFSHDLARSLANRGIWLARADRPADAVGPAEEAVQLYRKAGSQDSPRYQSELARFLSSLADRLTAADRMTEALPVSEESAKLLRQLAASDPGEYRLELVAALHRQHLLLADLGHATEAVPIAEEATQICRELAAETADSGRAALAESLLSLGMLLVELDLHSEALPAVEEAVAIYRDFGSVQPEGYGRPLALSLRVLVGVLGTLNRDAEAAAVSEEIGRIAAV